MDNSAGVFDMLSIKEPDIVDYPGEHGHDADLSQRRFQARTVTLNCGMSALSAGDLERQIAAFRRVLGVGISRLEVNAYSQVRGWYDVYCKDGFRVKKNLRAGKNLAWFNLSLIEPLPVKRVYSTYGRVASFEFESDKNISISWGDGVINSYCVQGMAHAYTDTVDKHYIIIAGSVENLLINTNCVLECKVYS